MRKGGFDVASVPFTLVIFALIVLISIFFIMNAKQGAIPFLDQIDYFLEQLIGA